VEAQLPTGTPKTKGSTPVTGAIEGFPPLVLTASKVDQLPIIDGQAGDEEWKSAKLLKLGVFKIQAVYTDNDIAFLMTWLQREPKINSQNNWSFDVQNGKWIAILDGERPQWFVMAFNMTGNVASEGCYAFCHEDPPGSGIMHHQTGSAGEFVDTWVVLGKHGYGPNFHDSGWLIGSEGTNQNGPVIFDTRSTFDKHMIIGGDVTFLGYAEDSVIDSPADTKYGDRNSTRDQYCRDCHAELNIEPENPTAVDYTHGDMGEPGYIANWNKTHDAPLYMQTAPKDYADAMILTQAELESGAAVRIEDLSNEQIAEYWANYEALNAVVPQVLLKTPTDSISDVYVAANWKDGLWTVEVTRKLDTGHDDDVQFSDLTKDYPFGISLWDRTILPKTDYLTLFYREVGTILRFQ